MVIMVIVQYCNNKSRLNNDVDMVRRMKRSGMVFEKNEDFSSFFRYSSALWPIITTVLID